MNLNLDAMTTLLTRKNPMTMYFMTPDFLKDLDELRALDLSEEERRIIEDMQRSVAIYREQSHRKRVKLILNQLMKDYPIWKDSRNLFKYGANHLTRGESGESRHEAHAASRCWARVSDCCAMKMTSVANDSDAILSDADADDGGVGLLA